MAGLWTALDARPRGQNWFARGVAVSVTGVALFLWLAARRRYAATAGPRGGGSFALVVGPLRLESFVREMTQILLRTIAFLALYTATAAILARSAVTWASKAGPTDKAATLAFIALSVLIPLVGVGATLTVIYLRFRGQGLRYAHLITFYFVLVGELIVLIADSDPPGLLLCWDCEGRLAWARLILPGSLFMLVAPLFVKGHYDVFGQS